MTISKKSTVPLPAEPYEPTKKELAVAKRYKDRADAGPPKAKLKITTTDTDGVRNVSIAIDHPEPALGWTLLTESIGAERAQVTEVVIDQVALLVQTKAGVKEEDVNRVLALVQGIAPRNPIETMLAVQMAAVHMATIKQAALLNAAVERQSPMADSASTSLNKLARTFSTQMDALKRHRSKGEQKVVVEYQHVQVYPGGQAVVSQGGGAETGGLPHERQLRLSERSAVLSAIEADQVPMQGASGEGVECMPVSRRQRRPALRAVE